MKTRLEQRVLDALYRGQMIAAGDRVAVGVSGGADSVALLRLLLSLRDTLGVTLLVLHFDHALRGEASDADARFVAALASECCVEFVCERADVAAVAAEKRLNLEDAARRLRYGFFNRIVEQGSATRVAVAHTADDQAETVLARLFRGTGPDGLAGIHPTLGVIFRPLLAIRRQELRDYLQGLGQAWREDLTNFDLSRQRAHIRAELLPVLEKDFSARIVNHLSQLASFAREEREFWTALVDDRMRAFVRAANNRTHERANGQVSGQLAIRISDLLSPLGPQFDLSSNRGPKGASPAVRTLTERLIRRLYEKAGGSQDLAATHVEQVIRLVTESVSGSKIELPGRVIAERVFDDLIFSQVSRPGQSAKTGEETQRTPRAYQYVLNVPRKGSATISVPELNTRFRLKVIDWSSMERDTKREDTLDAELLRPTLIVRNWEPGDSYRPLGHRGARKLKQLFLARRIPRSERARWPVIECGGRIVWVRNMPPAGDFCAGDHTKIGLQIEESSQEF